MKKKFYKNCNINHLLTIFLKMSIFPILRVVNTSDIWDNTWLYSVSEELKERYQIIQDIAKYAIYTWPCFKMNIPVSIVKKMRFNMRYSIDQLETCPFEFFKPTSKFAFFHNNKIFECNCEYFVVIICSFTKAFLGFAEEYKIKRLADVLDYS
jgi:hypothetical protein